MLPASRILDVHSERLVTESEVRLRRILEHCALPCDVGYLDFHSQHRQVATASGCR